MWSTRPTVGVTIVKAPSVPGDPDEEQWRGDERADDEPFHRVDARPRDPVESLARVVHRVEAPEQRHLVLEAMSPVAEQLEEENGLGRTKQTRLGVERRRSGLFRNGVRTTNHTTIGMMRNTAAMLRSATVEHVRSQARVAAPSDRAASRCARSV